jgi:glucosamine--fructose-6-phosphate aminotransferase (isomerizing)
LLAQPAAVEASLTALDSNDAVRSLATQGFARIVLTGMGGSLSALHPLALRLVESGATAMMLDTSELIHSMTKLLRDDTLVIAVSQSGRSAELVRLATLPERRAKMIAVTNTPGSPLATAADAVVLTQAGEEATVSCKTYVATLAALSALGDVLSGVPEDASAAPAAMTSYLSSWESHVATLLPLTRGIRDLFFAGRGSSLAAACTAGLIVKEAARVHAEGMTSAALRHGPLEMSADHVFALVYEGDPHVAELNRTLVADLRRAGARAHVAGPSAAQAVFQLPSHPAIRPFLEILPAQLLSLALAAHAGIEAGRFVHATKVTATE